MYNVYKLHLGKQVVFGKDAHRLKSSAALKLNIILWATNLGFSNGPR